MARVEGWWLRGSYFEACNCEAVCPCRVQGGAPGGSSTDGECRFALSWLIAEGRFDDESLAAGRPLLQWEVARPAPRPRLPSSPPTGSTSSPGGKIAAWPTAAPWG